MIPGSWVASTIVKMHVLALVMTTLFVRPQRDRRLGKNKGNNGSNSIPSPDATAVRTSRAAPDNRVRSEFIAPMRLRWIERKEKTTSAACSNAPDWHSCPNFWSPLEIWSQVSSESGSESECLSFSND